MTHDTRAESDNEKYESEANSEGEEDKKQGRDKAGRKLRVFRCGCQDQARTLRYGNTLAWHSRFVSVTRTLCFNHLRRWISQYYSARLFYPRHQRHWSAGASSTFENSGTYHSEHGDSSTFRCQALVSRRFSRSWVTYIFRHFLTAF